jgi:NADP-dependent 3-hydroxy acid dehydrogenase YdfG
LSSTAGKNNLYEFKMSQQKVWFMASRGFGPVWTEAVLKRGDKAAASARNPKALTAFFEVYGGAVLPLELDVTDRDAVFQAVREAHQHFGRLDVILSNQTPVVAGQWRKRTPDLNSLFVRMPPLQTLKLRTS